MSPATFKINALTLQNLVNFSRILISCFGKIITIDYFLQLVVNCPSKKTMKCAFVYSKSIPTQKLTAYSSEMNKIPHHMLYGSKRPRRNIH